MKPTGLCREERDKGDSRIDLADNREVRGKWKGVPAAPQDRAVGRTELMTIRVERSRIFFCTLLAAKAKRSQEGWRDE